MSTLFEKACGAKKLALKKYVHHTSWSPSRRALIEKLAEISRRITGESIYAFDAISSSVTDEECLEVIRMSFAVIAEEGAG